MSSLSYAIVTPARNEEGYIEKTIECVISQTLRPVKWVIVDDGSYDRTGDIARSHAKRHAWITFVRRSGGSSRDFASKARAFMTGYEQLREVDFEYIGNLDADILLEPDYYERLFTFFQADVGLGIAGGRFYDTAVNGKCYPVRNSPDSVRGAAQTFRRTCYEQTGGYIPLLMGGIDSAAEIMARMNGWKVRTFADLRVLHLRPTGGGMGSPLAALIRRGFQDRSLGYHGLFEVARCAALMRRRPYLIGGLSVLLGYCLSRLRGDSPALTSNVVSYLRREQLGKMFRRLYRK